MIRRLMHHFVDNYAHATATIRRLVDDNELWFVPVANPDGYDLTFQAGQRLWRKNLRDNNGDGQITAGDGVDLNRNFPTKWGYDNEGSSPDPASETYRGTGAGLRARDAGPGRPRAPRRLRVLRQLPLGRRAAALRHRLAGRHADARRRHLRGDGRRRRATRRSPATTRTSRPSCTRPTATPTPHMTERYGTLGFTPEMSTCEAASDDRPRRRVGGRGLRQRLRVPRRRGARAGRVREEHPVRALRGEVRQGPRRPGVRRRSHGRGLPRRQLRRLLRRPADGRGHRQAGAASTCTMQLPHQRRPHAHRAASGVAGRRALRRRERRLLRRAARRRPRRRRRRQGRGLVQRRRSRGAGSSCSSERFTYTVGQRHAAPTCS